VLDDLVTLASGFFEASSVKDNNPAAPIPDEPGFLKAAARAPRAATQLPRHRAGR
jgi:hypothetical protein